MDAIQALATQLMREFLKHCDISDHSLEPFNQSILDMATVGPELSVEKKAPHLLCHQVIVIDGATPHRSKRGSPTESSRPGKRSKTNPASADQVMDTILRKCVELHSKRAQVAGDKSWIPVKARKYNGEVKKYAEDIVVLDFRDAVRKLNEEVGHFACKAIQIIYNEALYWDIIQKQADVLDPLRLRATKGPSDGSGDAERKAAKELSTALGLRGFSPTSQQKYRRLWKNLANWRKGGVRMILFYRTTDFDNFCEKYSEEAKTPLDKKILSLEGKYGPHIQQLEHRVMKEARGDMTGRIWLQEPFIMERIKVPEESWNNANNPWLSDAEENQSVFITLIPRDEKLVYVCPIVTIHKGDYLGIFSGNIRYSDAFDKKRGVCGPTKDLWLDYGQVTGVLNQMKVSPPYGTENVRLEWELIDISVGMQCHQAWRVAVRALRTIKPFEELIRAARHEDQYLLHREPANAKNGYLSEG
ncbi:uncharacterized protein G6M90_00g030560 [Metarhizium brunneum]|uniref:Uncharacterized protein n=1 Tax=Metarhizium brunneum TaxID=500148 RepID=A0A7D5UV05_9HYPO|nr:hypothetical protein G6M90_00g030560 [Metarhizium brunneum]